MDALSDALRVMGLTGGIFLDACFTAPWSVVGKVGAEHCRPYMRTPTQVICFHFVVEGRCLAQVEGQPACELVGGDVVIFPRNDPHMLGSELGLRAVPVSELLKPPSGLEFPRIAHGGGGERTQLVCGFLGGEALLNPLLTSLPPILKITLAQIPGGDWIARSFAYAASDVA